MRSWEHREGSLFKVSSDLIRKDVSGADCQLFLLSLWQAHLLKAHVGFDLSNTEPGHLTTLHQYRLMPE